MTTNITFLSPDRRQGLTTVSILVSLMLGKTQNMQSALTFTGNSSTSVNTFLGLTPLEDKTRNLTQLVKLLESNAISGEEVVDYCTRIANVPNFMILDSASNAVSDDDSGRLVKFAIEHMETDFTVTDVATEIFDDVTKEVVEQSDLIVMVLTQSRDIWKKLKVWEEAKWDPTSKDNMTIMEKLSSKGLIFIFNQYDPYVEAFRDTTKKFGIRHRRCCKLSYNPWIRKTSNIGKLHTMIPHILAKDPRVIELHNDLKECLTVILANLGRKTQWPTP